VKLRKVVSLTALISFVLLILTSFVLYIVPQGRVAYWSDWRLLGMTKTDWGNIHINLGLLLLISIAFHIYYNWKAITAYLKNKSRKLTLFTPDFNLAAIIVVVCAVGTYFLVPPFSWVLALNASIKDDAARKYGEPPYGHAELSSLKSFTAKMGLDLEESMAHLKAAGIRVNHSDQSLSAIAGQNRLTPQQVYSAMKPAGEFPARPAGLPENPEPGVGRRTLADICNAYGLSIPTVLKGLESNRIQARADMTLKMIAEKNGRHPEDIYHLIREAVRP
jgi:hypothetical protein